MNIQTSPYQAKIGQIHVIPILLDNYTYVIEAKKTVILVDPGESGPVLQFLEQSSLIPDAILLTHGDSDHYDGIPAILAQYDIPVWVPEGSNRGGNLVDPNKSLQIRDIGFEILKTPGHRDHDLTFYCAAMEVAFCGDALFPGGCGRVNSGHPEWLWHSLLKIRSLPDSTALFCGHEYALANYRFALNEQPEDHSFLTREKELRSILHKGGSSMPSSIAQEKMSNIFLRCDNVAWQIEMKLQGLSAEEAFTEIRQRKNTF